MIEEYHATFINCFSMEVRLRLLLNGIHVAHVYMYM